MGMDHHPISGFRVCWLDSLFLRFFFDSVTCLWTVPEYYRSPSSAVYGSVRYWTIVLGLSFHFTRIIRCGFGGFKCLAGNSVISLAGSKGPDVFIMSEFAWLSPFRRKHYQMRDGSPSRRCYRMISSAGNTGDGYMAR